jgi:hypothetical protein
MLDVKTEVTGFFDSSYSLFNIKPLDKISSVAPVAREVKTIAAKDKSETFPNTAGVSPPCFI